jgi:catechol 2,3-dioxygenase-like lactoylglutathione lyase family enzyme
MDTNNNLLSIRPFFIVKDLPASIAYYRERLGFEVDFQGPDDDPYYAGVSRDGIGVMRRTAASKSQAPRVGALGRVCLYQGSRRALR